MFQGPYDGILSFSQGACLAAILCAMKPTEPILESLQFVVLFSGFKSRISKHEKFYTEHIDTVRSCHVYGETDEVIPLGLLLL